jgi:hypothetical protein
MSIEATVVDALDYLLATVGDKSVEGEAAKLRSALHDAAGTVLGEDHPGRLETGYGDPRARQQAARDALAKAQADVEAADAALAPLPPLAAVSTPTPVTPTPAPADTESPVPPAPSFSG